MNTLPIAADRLGALVFIQATPKIDRETGAQKTNRDNLPSWGVQLLHTPAPTADGYQAKAEVVEITVHAADAPALPPMTPVTPTDLMARMWEMNGRAGISLTASGIAPVRGNRGE